MVTNKKNKVSQEDGVDFMPDVEIQSEDRLAILETIYVKVQREKRNDVDNLVSIESSVIEQLFFSLENAANSIVFDLKMDKKRPTNGQSVEILNRIKSKSAELGQLFETIDNIAGKALKKQNFDTGEISKLLSNISEAIKDDILESVTKNKSLLQTIHPFRIMSVNVIKALYEADLLSYFETDKKKVSFIEDVMRHLLELPAVENEITEITGDEDYSVKVYLRDHILAELRNFNKTNKILNSI
ncbi:hypothetical protein [Methylophaga thalassica]|uniref:hypothetical protein n=1 Tax=Methylophaga aminisulfidivorans TaxID=230105 RepID=UPI003A940718